jgi:excisionase family DNA binding protein
MEKPEIGDRWLSVEEISGYLGVKRDTVYKWISEKKMPAHKIGRLWKFKKDEVDNWVRGGGTKVEKTNNE